MLLKNPIRPKNYFKWSLRKRQLFAKYMWDPWWKIYKFFNGGPKKAIWLMVERLKFRFSMWKYRRNYGR